MLEPFAIDHDRVQLWWPALPAGRRAVAVGGVEVAVDADGGAGAVEVAGLPAATDLDVRLDGALVCRVRTLDALGPVLSRVATVSDVHIGEPGFGALIDRKEHGGVEPYPLRCLRSALGAARSWGADHLVVKGDLTQESAPEEFEAAARTLAGQPLPVSVTWGNHDVERHGVDGAPILRRHGIDPVVEPTAVDLPGVRVVVVDSTIPGKHHGTLRDGRAEQVLDLAAAAAADGRPCIVALHHQLYRRVPSFWPPGIFDGEGAPFLRDLARANPRTLVTSGHTHRNRARRVGPLLLTEVGSTKDHPGTWAGYSVHERGVRQVVRKVTGDGTDAWLWGTRRALGGVWGRWSPGRIEQRCVDLRW